MTSSVSIQLESTILTPEGCDRAREQVAVEAVYSVMLNEVEIGAAMVLPADLEEFGVGFLFGRGYLQRPDQIKEVLVCPEGTVSVYAEVEQIEPQPVVVTSGCGGTGAIPREFLEGSLEPPLELNLPLAEAGRFIRQMLQHPSLGPTTHGVHACGSWAEGRLQSYYEDIGRHNAVDKLLGAILLGKAPARAAVFTTGRLTSDMVLKCARMRIPILMSRTSASSLGVAVARRAGLSLASYCRPRRLNVFCGAERFESPC